MLLKLLILFYLFLSIYTQSTTSAQVLNDTIILPILEANPTRSLVPLDFCPICPNNVICDTCEIPISNSIQIRNTMIESRQILQFQFPIKSNITNCKLQIGNLLNNSLNLSPSNSEIIVNEGNNNVITNVNWNNMPNIIKEIGRLDVTLGNLIDITTTCMEYIKLNKTLILILSPSELGPTQLYLESKNSNNGAKLIIN
ncbi:hypothetical protein K502DRAFT_349892 [Neoconidiobolus thromboides FSU 785]|nr:hypothetical protein K502DRAFT_349892 [Neoconidiobolus thromboides FSU 785]